MRVLIWASALQADILALALYLDRETEHEVLVAGTGIDAWLQQPIAERRPFSCALLERTDSATKQAVLDFEADVTVIDNHFPEFRTSPAICKMWHGLGWKAPDAAHLKAYHGHVKHLTGMGPDEPNPRFLAQCYGPHDREWRITGMGIHNDNCAEIGMPFADLITNPPYTRADVAGRYQIDVLGRKTVLVNFTWHYGSITNQSARIGLMQRLLRRGRPDSSDALFLEELCQRVTANDANALFCMHDRKRYDKAYLQIFNKLEQQFGAHIQVKFKDEHPDNLADLLVADIMVSNLSSFITFFYHTGRPSIHLCPVRKNDRSVAFARTSRKGVRYRAWDIDEAFMTRPDDNGGLTAYSKDECLDQIMQALLDPDCCKERSRAFLEAKLPGYAGDSCRRYTEALEALHQRSQQAAQSSA